MSFKFAQLQSYSLSGAGAVSGATSVTIQSMKDIDGNDLVMSTAFGAKGFGTIEPGNGALEEQIVFTGLTNNSNGTTTLTGVSSVSFLSPYTETSGLSKTHAGSTTFVISNTSGYYDQFAAKADDATITGTYTFPTGAANPRIGSSYVAPTGAVQIATKQYVDDTASFGAPFASDTTNGILKLSLAPASATGPIGVGDNDTRVPPIDTSSLTTGRIAALAGSLGTPSSGNKYVTEADTTGSLMPSGSITMYGGSAAPPGWLLCDGTSYLRATYPNLFTTISTTYGAADGSHFNVPDLRGRAPVGVGTGAGGGASGATGVPVGGAALTARTLGAWTGEETHVLTIGELAAHTHTTLPDASPLTGVSGSGANTIKYSASGSASGSVGSTGSDTAHNTMQPVLSLNFIIRT